jgi:hypothetical protein
VARPAPPRARGTRQPPPAVSQRRRPMSAPTSTEPAAAPRRQELILGRPGKCVQRRGDKRAWVRRPG